MSPHTENSPWPEGTPFPAGSFIYDLIYNPRQTKLMQEAQAAGCKVSNGLGMLVYQGALAFEIWLGLRPDENVMLQAIKHSLGQREPGKDTGRVIILSNFEDPLPEFDE
jgi:shikimate dehydrogenase